MKKILLIEDDQIVSTIYRNKFVNDGYRVEVAADGVTGLTLVKEFRPDVIILDLMLPGVTGTELLRTIRAERELEKVPIVVFSNTYLTTLVQEAWKAGATKCLSKANCTPRQLIDVVRGLIGSADAMPEKLPASSHKPAGRPVSEKEDLEALRKKFVAEFPAALVAIRSAHQELAKAEGDAARGTHVSALYRGVRNLTGSAGVSGMAMIAQVSDALEALLKELEEKPQDINVSTLRTIASAIDLLGILFRQAGNGGVAAAARALVVDDEPLSRRAIVKALEKVNIKFSESDDANKALDFLMQNRYDLVFLDVDMPGMNGFELCSKLRALPNYKKTPVVFVTGLTDFESRASSMMSGGNDFIGKPFLIMELAVKALVFVMRAKTAPQGK